MRTAFHEQLDSLTELLSNMCGLAGVAMDRATQGLLHADLAMAEQVIGAHDQLASQVQDDDPFVFALINFKVVVKHECYIGCPINRMTPTTATRFH